MAELKTKPTTASVAGFIKSVEDPVKRRDCQTLKMLMAEITGNRARMWGDSIVGFGNYHYKYKSGREGDYFLTGFSPRKQNLTVYIMPGFKKYTKELKKLGKHRHSSSCLYLKNLGGVDMEALAYMIEHSVQRMREMYPSK